MVLNTLGEGQKGQNPKLTKYTSYIRPVSEPSNGMSITCIFDEIDRVTAECRYYATEYNRILHIIAGTEAKYQSDAESTKYTHTSL